ncbi:MAG: hypothetical protein ABW217_12435, partial [Polyangiaceae bacterium]
MKARLLRRSHVFYAMTVIAGLALLGAARGGAQAEVAPRYPFDPLCPWGRISDGHGMLLRCLQPAEATALVQGPPGQGPQTSAPIAEAPQSAPLPVVSTAPSIAGAPVAAAPTPSMAERPSSAASARAQNAAVSQIGPLSVDTGDLPIALGELRKPRQRYSDCVNQNGGVTGGRGRVEIRFLVRELGRAEGVLVKAREGVSLEAAKCIAGVI